MPAAETERFERHLSACSSCLAAVQKLSCADSLVESVKAQAATPAPVETDTVRELMARLKAQPPAAATEVTTELSTTPPPASEGATLAPAADATEAIRA